MKKIIFSIILIAGSLFSQESTKQVFDAAKGIQEGDKKAIAGLYALSLEKDNDKLNPELTQAVTLQMLLHSPTRLSQYVQKINKLYPDSNYFEPLTFPPLRTECSKCKGFGQTHTKCLRCRDGNCRNCKGEGYIAYGNGKSRQEKDCLTCKGIGKCGHCIGTKAVSTKCKVCRTSGVAFNKKAIPSEAKRILSILMMKAADMDSSIEFTSDETLQNQHEEIVSKGKVWLTELQKKKASWPELEKKRLLAAAQKAKKPKVGSTITMVEEEVVETYEEGGSTPTLDQICLEVNDYLKAQELKSKQKFLEKVYGQFLSDLPTIHIVVNSGFTNASYDYRQRAGDGFLRFSLLRAQRNGYDSIGFKLLDNEGSIVGGIDEKGEFWVKK